MRSPALAEAASTATRIVSPAVVRTVAPAAEAATTSPVSRFMRGLPMKPATNRLAGRWYRSIGAPTCSIRPPFSTTIRSARVMASTWSWVT